MSDQTFDKSASPKKKILVFCDFYLPSIKSGGGTWMVVNIIEKFCDRYEFYVVTRNYDSKSDTVPYSTVETGKWNQVGSARVFYLAANDITRLACARLADEVGPDCVFLNSAMSDPVVKFLSAKASGLIRNVPVILAPCGEFSPGALRIKSLKKKIFFRYAKVVQLFKGLIWKASSDIEVGEIRRTIGSDVEAWLAPDLTPKTILPKYSAEMKPLKTPGSVRFVSLSRLVPIKNILFFLQRLAEIGEGNVVFDLVGPIEDRVYLAECMKVVESLPKNIVVNVIGPVSYSDGLQHLCAGHFFVLPTLNENFGYVMIESLAAGCPLMISDRTPWNEVEAHGAGWIISPGDKVQWTETINSCIQMATSRYTEMSASAREYAVKWLAETNVDEATSRLFERAMAGRAKSQQS